METVIVDVRIRLHPASQQDRIWPLQAPAGLCGALARASCQRDAKRHAFTKPVAKSKSHTAQILIATGTSHY